MRATPMVQVSGRIVSNGIELLPPDVNASHAGFVVEETEAGAAIRYALGAVRNVGMEAMRQLVQERESGGRFISLMILPAALPM